MFTKSKSEELRGVFHGCRRYFVTALIFSLGHQPALSRRAALHAAGLRPGDLEREPRHAGDADHRAAGRVRRARRPRRRARARADAGERAPRPAAGRARARGDHGIGGIKGAPPTSQTLRDFDTFRQFITGAGIHAVFDLPWAPIYIFVIFLLHPLLGAVCAGVGDRAGRPGRLRPMARAGPDGGGERDRRRATTPSPT